MFVSQLSEAKGTNYVIKPYYSDEKAGIVIYHGELNPVVVERPNACKQLLTVREHLWIERPPSYPNMNGTALFSWKVFGLAQREKNISLLSFDSEVGPKRTDSCDGMFVRCAPTVGWSPVLRMRSGTFPQLNVSAEQFFQPRRNNGQYLREANKLTVRRGSAYRPANHRNEAIGIHRASKVSEFQFLHSLSISHVWGR